MFGCLSLGGCPAADEGADGDESGMAGSTTGGTSSAADSSTAPVTTADVTSGADTSASTGPQDASESSTTLTSTTDSATGGELCAIDLPPGPGCGYQPELGVVVGGAAPTEWGELDEVLPDEVHGGVGFIQDPDVGETVQCDIFAQNCPDGEKCMPWADDGGSSWNATRCTPIAEDPVDIGGACEAVGGGLSGVDDCVRGAMCWGVDDTGMGHCVEQCSCTADTPVCATPNTACVITNADVLALCLGVCNPLDPEACEDGNGCFPVGGLFHCAPDASGGTGAPGDACAFLNACDPGTFCASTNSVPGCAGSPGCCSSLCTVGESDACLDGQECVPWYEDGLEPDDCLGLVGACTVP